MATNGQRLQSDLLSPSEKSLLSFHARRINEKISCFDGCTVNLSRDAILVSIVGTIDYDRAEVAVMDYISKETFLVASNTSSGFSIQLNPQRSRGMFTNALDYIQAFFGLMSLVGIVALAEDVLWTQDWW